MNLNFDLATPIYAQIIDEFKKSIVRGEMPPGSKLPSQREMAQKLSVNPNTVQRAYREMERLELVETLRGEGTFVSQSQGLVERIRAEMAGRTVEQFLAEMAALGLTRDEVKSLLTSRIDSYQPVPAKQGADEGGERNV